MSKRIITFGKWNDQPIEWVVLKEDHFQLLVISRWVIEIRRFDSSSSGRKWKDSELRSYLQNEFYEKAFTVKEKQQIVNTKLEDVGDTKDNVFILSKEEMIKLLADGDDYENRYYNRCDYCTWTRTQNGSYVLNGYAKGCWCGDQSLNCPYAVRPAMFLKKTTNGVDGVTASS